MIGELDSVALLVDLPERGLHRGDIGTVVLLHGSAGFEVEFMDQDGETIAVETLKQDQVRAIQPHEHANTRTLNSTT
jgi:Domain of unknown function (DUF4926)